MKIRNGFVSNSSSSSFLVAFDKIPESENVLKNMMFPDMDWDDHIVIYDMATHVSDVVSRVYSDLQNNDKYVGSENIPERVIINNFFSYDLYKKAEKIMESQYPELSAKINDYKGTTIQERQEGYDKLREIESELAKKEYKSWVVGKEYCTFVEFSYSDNEGETILEHYGIFKNLKCKTTSHH